MSANSRRRNKLERKLRREAELRNNAQPAEETGAAPVLRSPGEGGSASARPESLENVPQPETPQRKPARKGAKRLLETAADELEQSEVEFLEEVLATAKEAMELHRLEIRDRAELQRRGEPAPKRWQVSPSNFEKLVAKAVMVIEVRLARRRAMKEAQQRLAG
jgi:hypothetical protein